MHESKTHIITLSPFQVLFHLCGAHLQIAVLARHRQVRSFLGACLLVEGKRFWEEGLPAHGACNCAAVHRGRDDMPAAGRGEAAGRRERHVMLVWGNPRG